MKRKLGYWGITAYITVSLPGHVGFLVTGDTQFFDAFPWWFSLAVLAVYVLIVAYVVTLRRLPEAQGDFPNAPGTTPNERSTARHDGRKWLQMRSPA